MLAFLFAFSFAVSCAGVWNFFIADWSVALIGDVPAISIDGEKSIPLVEFCDLPEFDENINYTGHLKVKFLQTGEFHEDEVPYRSGEKWLGLFRVGNSYQLMETSLRKKRVKDEGLYDTEVSTTTPYESVFLLQGAKTLRPGKIETIFDSKGYEEFASLKGAEPKGFGRRGQFWKIWIANPDNDGFLQKGSSLMLQRSGFDVQVLRSLPAGCDDCGWSVLWVGDLDNDSNLDFLIDMSRHYNSYEPTLFLSSASKEVGWVGIFAGFHGVGC